MTRDPRVLRHVKKLTSKSFARAFPGHNEYYATRASQAWRVVMTPTVKGWKVLGLVRRGGQLYAAG